MAVYRPARRDVASPDMPRRTNPDKPKPAPTKRKARIDNAAMAHRMDVARQRLDLSWLEVNRRVGQRLGWSASTTNYLNRIRNSSVDPSKSTIEAIAESLHVRSGWLMDGHGSMDHEGTISALPGYKEALRIAKERYGHRVPEELWSEVGMFPAPGIFSSISAEELHDVAMFLLRRK